MEQYCKNKQQRRGNFKLTKLTKKGKYNAAITHAGGKCYNKISKNTLKLIKNEFEMKERKNWNSPK